MTSFDDLKILSPRPRRKLHRSQSLTTMAGAAIVANFAKLRHHNSNIERRPSIPPSLKVCSNFFVSYTHFCEQLRSRANLVVVVSSSCILVHFCKQEFLISIFFAFLYEFSYIDMPFQSHLTHIKMLVIAPTSLFSFFFFLVFLFTLSFSEFSQEIIG